MRCPTLLLLLCLPLASCGGEPANVAAPPGSSTTSGAPLSIAQPPPPPRDDGRLPVTATPLRYALSLRVDPAQPRFSGTTTIEIQLDQPLDDLAAFAGRVGAKKSIKRLFFD